MDKSNKSKKAWYKRIWVWVIIVFVLIAFAGAGSKTSQTDNTSGSPQMNNEAQKQTKPTETWNLEDAYGKVQNGMTKSEVETATGKKSENCTESEDPTFGKTEFCNYGNPFIDKGSITVTYRQEKVESKTKSTY